MLVAGDWFYSTNYLYGDDGNDSLLGGAGNEILYGGTGIDTLDGGFGDDTYIVDSTNDTITESLNEVIAPDEEVYQNTDTVESSVAYTLGNNLENLVLTGTSAITGTGNTLDNGITGNDANNLLYGGDGDDNIGGGLGKDTLSGGTGNDSYTIDSTTDTITEYSNQGTDTVNSSVSYTLGNNLEDMILSSGSSGISGTGNNLDNNISTSDANNSLYGLGGNDTLLGSGGSDILDGGTGNDYLLSFGGSDKLTGGTGADNFGFFDSSDGIDTITDFSVADDTITVYPSGFNGGLTAGAVITPAQFVLGTAAIDKSDRFIYNQKTGGLFFDSSTL